MGYKINLDDKWQSFKRHMHELKKEHEDDAQFCNEMTKVLEQMHKVEFIVSQRTS